MLGSFWGHFKIQSDTSGRILTRNLTLSYVLNIAEHRRLTPQTTWTTDPPARIWLGGERSSKTGTGHITQDVLTQLDTPRYFIKLRGCEHGEMENHKQEGDQLK